jgi:hypothetical protein
LDRVQSQEEIRERIGAFSDRDLILSVSLTGIKPLGLVVNPTDLVQELSSGFFALKINDSSQAAVSTEDLAQFPENLVIGQFVRRMNALIQEATSSEERKIRESAFQVGIALLQGKRVL